MAEYSDYSTTLPLISIITPSFNQGKFIRETIESVLSQGYSPLEHLVIDGGSTDSTVQILKEYPHLDWTSEKDRGQTDAVNKGAARAHGEIIGWINSDDVFFPGTIQAVAAAFLHHPEYSIVFGDYDATDENGKLLYTVESFCGNYQEMIRWWDYTYAIHQPTVFVRRKVFDIAGLLNETFHYAMDYEWWLRAARHFPFHHLPVKMATYRMHRDAKTFAPLEQFVYPEQLRASKQHWGPIWTSRYWKYRKSYESWKLRKQAETMHNPVLQDFYHKPEPGGYNHK